MFGLHRKNVEIIAKHIYETLSQRQTLKTAVVLQRSTYESSLAQINDDRQADQERCLHIHPKIPSSWSFILPGVILHMLTV